MTEPTVSCAALAGFLRSDVYVPVYRLLKGETTALYNLPAAVRERTMPLLAVLPAANIPVHAVEEGYERPGVDPVDAAVRRLLEICPRRGLRAPSPEYVYLDTAPLDRAGQASHLGRILGADIDEGRIVPVARPSAAAAHLAACAELHARTGNGIGLRVRASDHRAPAAVAAVLAACGVSFAEVDLLLDGEYLAAVPGWYAASEAEMRALLRSFAPLGGWRSITALAGAFPSHLSFVGARDYHRFELPMWRALRAEHAGLRLGDYSIVHPRISLDRPRSGLPTLRYAGADSWRVYRQPRTSSRPLEPYQRMASACTELAEFAPERGCWGDERIEHVARGGAERAQSWFWLALGHVHHASVASSQIRGGL